MEVSGLPHAPATSPKKKETPISIVYEVGWDVEPVIMFWSRQNSMPIRIGTTYHLTCGLVIVPTVLFQLPVLCCLNLVFFFFFLHILFHYMWVSFDWGPSWFQTYGWASFTNFLLPRYYTWLVKIARVRYVPKKFWDTRNGHHGRLQNFSLST
jgi:hypothetical protein